MKRQPLNMVDVAYLIVDIEKAVAIENLEIKDAMAKVYNESDHVNIDPLMDTVENLVGISWKHSVVWAHHKLNEGRTNANRRSNRSLC